MKRRGRENKGEHGDEKKKKSHRREQRRSQQTGGIETAMKRLEEYGNE